MFKKLFSSLIVFIFLINQLFAVANNQPKENNKKTYEYIIKYKYEKVLKDEKNTLDLSDDSEINQKIKNKIEKHISKDIKLKIKDEIKENKKGHKKQLITIESTDSKENIINELRSIEGIEYVEENYKLKKFNDSDFDKQWPINHSTSYDINVMEAWNLTRGNSDVTVAVLDTGIDINHTDLSDNIVSGWNFTEYVDDSQNGNDQVYENENIDEHGTHVAGIIAAVENGTGVQGIAPNVKIMPLKILGEEGGTVFHAIKAIEYANSHGVKIANCSWGIENYSQFLYDAIEQSDILFVCASGNEGENFSQYKTYPSAYDLNNIISVAAINSNGDLSDFSNYGVGVDIAAPGENIYSTLPNNKYGYMDGTSMAAPFVTGVAALVASVSPESTAEDIKNKIINNATTSNKLTGQVECGGYLNAHATLGATNSVNNNMTESRYGAEFVKLNDEIYAIGGYDGDNFIRTISKYDLSSNSWVNVGDLTYAVAKMSVTTYGDTIYIFGGYDGSIVPKIQTYNTKTGDFTAETEIPEPFFASSCVTIGSIVYFFGGITDEGYSNEVYTYDILADEWEEKTIMPFSNAYGQACVLNDEIFLIGGTDGTKCFNTIYKYDIASEQLILESQMNLARKDFGLATINNRIYIIGGSSSFDEDGKNVLLGMKGNLAVYSDVILDSVEIYKPQEKICETSEPLDSAVCGAGALEYCDSIYLFGGWNGNYTSNVIKYFGIEYPQNIKFNTDNENVTVSWNAVNDATNYEIEICGESFYSLKNEYTFLLSTFSSEYDLPVRVRSIKDNKYSSWSDMVYYSLNASMNDAQSITFDFSLNDKLYTTAQSKWYKFSTGKPGIVNLTLSNVPVGCSYVMQLRNSSGNIIEESTDNISDIVVTQYNYYITVTSTSGGSTLDSYTIEGSFTPSSESTDIPERIKSYLMPGKDEGNGEKKLSLKDISEYEGENIPVYSEDMSLETERKNTRGGGVIINQSEPEVVSTEIADETIMAKPMSIVNFEVENGSLKREGDVENNNISINGSELGVSQNQKGKLVIAVVPENPEDVFSMEWAGDNTYYNRFTTHWYNEPKQYYLMMIFTKFTDDKYQYKITYDTKSKDSNGNYSIYTYMVIDDSTCEDFNTNTGNDMASEPDLLSFNSNSSITVQGKIDNLYDRDFYKVSLKANQKLTAFIEYPNGIKYYMSILDHEGNTAEYEPSQYVNSWYRSSENISWSVTSSGSSSRSYLILVEGAGQCSPDEHYTLTVCKYDLDSLGDYEINDDFIKADSKTPKYGTTAEAGEEISFNIDSPMDRDFYAVDLDKGDKISIQMVLPENYNDSLHQYRIGICSNAEQDNDGMSASVSTYNNPDSAYSKFVTYIAEESGRYYVMISSLNKSFDVNITGELIITKVLEKDLADNEDKGLGYTNDFIENVRLKVDDVMFTIGGYKIIEGNVSSAFDNELDVDWYAFINRKTDKNYFIYLCGYEKINNNCGFVIFDEEHNLLSTGQDNLIYSMRPNELYYIGVYVKDGKYNDMIDNSYYTINIKEYSQEKTLELDNNLFGLKRMELNTGTGIVDIHLTRQIPSDKMVVVSCIMKEQKNGKFYAPVDSTYNYIDHYSLEGVNTDEFIGEITGYEGTLLTTFKVVNTDNYKVRLYFHKPNIQLTFYLAFYTVDRITDTEKFTHMDSLEQNIGEVGNYLIFNGPEQLKGSGHLADNKYYISRMAVKGNANIYWEHGNMYSEPMRYGILLHNTSDTPTEVKINKKSAYSRDDAESNDLPLDIWKDILESLITTDYTGITKTNNVLTIMPNSSEWIYLDLVHGDGTIDGSLFNGIINLSVQPDKELMCYAFIFNSNAQKQIEMDYNMYNLYGNTTGYNEYSRVAIDRLIFSGSTDAPVLDSGIIDLSGRDNYKLLLTGDIPPLFNSGESTPMYYEGEPVENSAYSRTTPNFSVVYKLNIKNYIGTRVIFEFNPYTNSNVLVSGDSGNYIIVWNENGREIALLKHITNPELVFDFNKVSKSQIPKDYTLYFTVSSMSSMPILLRFE